MVVMAAIDLGAQSGRVALGRFDVNPDAVLPEDVAEAIVSFVGPRSARSTGNVLNVDGGVTAAYSR